MSLLDNAKREQHKFDLLVDYLTKCFDEAHFDAESDGTMWCSDSNATLDPHQIAKDIREMLNAPHV